MDSPNPERITPNYYYLLSSQFRIWNITEAVGDEVEGEDGDEDGEGGKDGKPWCTGELIEAIMDHGPPAP